MTDLDKLEELAKAATPGPWNWTGGLETHDASLESPGEEGYVLCAYGLHTEGYVDVGLADAAFIAAANPAVVLEWVADDRAALARIAKVEALHQPVGIEPSEDICGHCSLHLPNGNYFGKFEEWPCETVRALTEGENE